MEFLRQLFSANGFMPLGHCYLWNPGVVWLHVISDAMIALAYFSIPVTLVYFVRQRKDLAFHGIFLFFAVFILACGTTHVLEISSIWNPTYWLSGAVKAVTGVISVATAILLVGVMPKALALPSRVRLRMVNEALENEIVLRKQTEALLVKSADELEEKNREAIRKQTEALTHANEALQAEISERKRIEQELRELTTELERRVRERTAQIGAANRDLENEIAERKLTEALLRESEERFRFLVLGVKDYAIYGLDAEGRVAGWNDGAERIKGYSASEIIGKPISTFYSREERAGGKPQQLLRFAIQEGRVEDEGWRVRKDGSQFWANVVITALRNESGQLRGFAEVARDITERKETERVLQASEASLRERTVQLEASNKELETFSYSVSHDLRAPLRAIEGFSQALQEDSADRLDEAGKKHLLRIRDATQRMGQLIDGLLALSRFTRSDISREELDLSEVSRSILEELRRSDPARQVEPVIKPGLTALGDPRLLRVALENLLQNAWKFSRKNPRSRIEVGVIEQNGERAYYVRDNGAGFDMAYQSKLFGAFQRLHNKNEFEGTGIGLATVQRIIHRHGGRIWAESIPDEGATFYFTLPVT